MKKYEENILPVMQFAGISKAAKTVSSWHKKKIPIEIRRKYYEETVAQGIKDYNFLCQNWLKENVK